MTAFELHAGEPDFPKEVLLAEHPPRVLYAIGDVSLLRRPRVAIIGSRRPSAYGIRVAYAAASALAREGVTIISGAALGLDARAHRGALDAGGGTIAVLGCGPDLDYPPPNARLLAEIRTRGLVLSEYPPGKAMRAWHFPERNRIIAALAQLLLVVEGKVKGGTSNTVKWAGDLSVKLMAVPGHVDDPLAEGPNLLIQNGAGLFLHVNDILDHIGRPLLPRDTSAADALTSRLTSGVQARAELTGAEAALFDLITQHPTHVDVLANRTTLDPGLLLAALSSLELQGLVTQLPGKHFALAS